jgi:hypothetical protein
MQPQLSERVPAGWKSAKPFALCVRYWLWDRVAMQRPQLAERAHWMNATEWSLPQALQTLRRKPLTY